MGRPQCQHHHHQQHLRRPGPFFEIECSFELPKPSLKGLHFTSLMKNYNDEPALLNSRRISNVSTNPGSRSHWKDGKDQEGGAAWWPCHLRLCAMPPHPCHSLCTCNTETLQTSSSSDFSQQEPQLLCLKRRTFLLFANPSSLFQILSRLFFTCTVIFTLRVQLVSQQPHRTFLISLVI